MSQMIQVQQEGLTLLKAQCLEGLSGVAHAYTTRVGGVSAGEFASLNFRHTGDSPENIKENCRRAAAQVGCVYEDLVRTKQEHTDRIDVVRQWAPGIRIGFGGQGPSDGLVTNVPGVCLMGFYADCQLLLFCDPVQKAIGCAHSGWRGTVQGIGEKVIDLMAAEYGSKPEDLRCAIGPSICQDCFETDGDVTEQLVEAFGQAALEFCRQQGQKYHWDTKGLNKWRLEQAGLLPEHISVAQECTCCGNEALWWSHRRQGLQRGVHAGLIALNRV